MSNRQIAQRLLSPAPLSLRVSGQIAIHFASVPGPLAPETEYLSVSTSVSVPELIELSGHLSVGVLPGAISGEGQLVARAVALAVRIAANGAISPAGVGRYPLVEQHPIKRALPQIVHRVQFVV